MRYRALLPCLILVVACGGMFPGASHAGPYGADWNDVSEYLIGKVYVKVFFLESNEKSPNTENWTEEEKKNCRDALERALGEIRKRFIREFEVAAGSGKTPQGVGLDFIFDYETVEVSVEPIKLNGSGIVFSRGDLHLWVNEVMRSKGFSGRIPPRVPNMPVDYPPYQYNVAEYADSLRNKHGTDWATVIFFYDNSEDEDGLFANKREAGPPMGVGGPGLHFSNNRGKPFSDKFAGIIHEFLHAWYAIDEHTMNKHFKEDAVIGYLAGENRNYGKAESYRSVMYTPRDWPEMSPYTKKQIGWWDSNGNKIPDILDVPPAVSVTPDFGKGRNAFRGRAFSPPLPNRNPYSEGGTIKPPFDLSVVLHLVPTPERRLGIRDLFRKVPSFQPPFPWRRNSITINKITSVEYRLLKDEKPVSSWSAAKAVDGAFDSALEDFSIEVERLKPGKYTIEVKATNSVNLYSNVLVNFRIDP